MKIGIDIRVLGKNRTGDEVYFFNLVKNLAAIDRINEYHLYTDRDPAKDGDLRNEVEKLKLTDNFKIIFINSSNRFWWNLWAIPNHLRKNPVDIFHTQYIAPFWLPKKVKLVLTIHDISFNFFPQYIKKSDLYFLKTLLPRSIRRADKIITVSESEQEQITKFYNISPEKVGFAYNGVDFESFNQKFPPQELEKITSKYKIPDTNYLLYVGTLQPRKNIPALIEALKSYKEKYPKDDMKLVVVGNRKARNFDEKIDEVIPKYGLVQDVIFPGWIDDEDLPKIYRLARCFVFASLYEGFGIPIVEAMAAGLPVVSSEKSCLPEVGKDAVVFVDPDDSDDFAKKIHQILTDDNLRNEKIRKGIELAKEYSWQKTAEKTLEIFEDVSRT